METQNGIYQILSNNPLIPVVTIKSVDEVEVIINTLVEKDIYCIEITLRTDAAFDCIARAKAIAPSNFKIGVGTLIDGTQVEKCLRLEVDFLVSPGATPFLIQTMQKSGIAYIPGVMTPSEIIQAVELGCKYLKFFPFNLGGGEKALKTYAGVFPQVKFCPTGGISEETYQQILELPNVLAVGGSWLL